MLPQAPTAFPQESETDREILERFYHPETVGIAKDLCHHLSDLYRRIKKLEERELLYNVGTFRQKAGRPRHVYSTWQVNRTQIKHEVMLSRVLRSWGLDALRGQDVGPQKPDAELGRICVEMDLDTEGWPQVKRRMRGYCNTDQVVVFVTTNGPRRDRLFDHCPFLADGLLACTIEQAMQGVARDAEGKQWELKKVWKNVLKSVFSRLK